MFPTLPSHEPGILHHPPSIARFHFSAPELQFQFGNLTVEGSQGPDCRVTCWGDGFLLQVSLSLGPCFFPYGFPVFFLVSHPSFTSSGPPTFVLSFFKTYPAMSSGTQAGASLPRPITSPPDTHFTNTPKLPAQHPKEKPSLHEAGHPPPPPPPCHDSRGSAVLPKGRLPKKPRPGGCVPSPWHWGTRGHVSPRGGTAWFIEGL